MTMKTIAKTGLSASIHALRELDRMAGVARDSLRLTNAIAKVSLPDVQQAQPPAYVSLPAMKFLRSERSRVDGSRSILDVQLMHNEEARRDTAASIRSHASLLNPSPLLTVDPSSMNEQFVDFRNAARAISAASSSSIQAVLPKVEASTRTRGVLELNGATLAGKQFRADASSLRALTPLPPSVAQREFARPIRIARDRNHGSSNAGVNINSSPTIVINTTAAGTNLQRDVLSALRAHRDELFDQLKRESARRERAQF